MMRLRKGSLVRCWFVYWVTNRTGRRVIELSQRHCWLFISSSPALPWWGEDGIPEEKPSLHLGRSSMPNFYWDFCLEGTQLPYFWLLEGVMEAGSTRTLLSRGTSSDRLPVKDVRSVILKTSINEWILNMVLRAACASKIKEEFSSQGIIFLNPSDYVYDQSADNKDEALNLRAESFQGERSRQAGRTDQSW